MPHLHVAPYEKSSGLIRFGRLHPAILVLIFSLVASLASLTLVSSRGVFSDPTDNLGNSFAAAASFGGITQVQKASAGTAGNASSISATYGSTPAQDNLLVLVHHYRNTGTLTLPAGWTEAVSQQGSGSTITIAYKVAGAAEGTDVTVSVSPSGHQTMTIFEYEGLSIVTPLDQTASNFDITTTTSCSTGTTPTTTGADQLLIAGIGLNGTSDGWANTWTNSFSQQSTVVSTGGSAANRSASSTADRIVTATGTYETTESWTTSRNCQAAIVTFTAL